MPSKSPRKVVGRLTQTEYGIVRALTDEQQIDAASLETAVTTAVTDRFELANGFIEAAKLLAASGNPLVRRSAVSRAYYAAYHAARATVFAVRRRDENDHEKLPKAVDQLPGQDQPIGDSLKELRELRREMDYSPYPGPDAQSEYDQNELNDEIPKSIATAEHVVVVLTEYLAHRE